MATIYGLFTGQLCWYVGSTDRNAKQRCWEHRSKGSSSESRFIPKEYVWEMKVLEICKIDEKKGRECHYYDALMPFYGRRAITDVERKKWLQKERKARYYLAHQEEIKRKVKEYAKKHKTHLLS